MAQKLNFEEAWRSHVMAAPGENKLGQCLSAALTLDQIRQVFYAVPQTDSSNLRSRAIKKMLTVVKTAEEARWVYTIASARGRGKLYFPSCSRLAKEKLASFETI